jgi:hypothetical protein
MLLNYFSFEQKLVGTGFRPVTDLCCTVAFESSKGYLKFFIQIKCVMFTFSKQRIGMLWIARVK